MAAIYKKLGYSADDIQSIENTVSGNVLTTKITLKSGEEITATANLPQEGVHIAAGDKYGVRRRKNALCGFWADGESWNHVRRLSRHKAHCKA